MITGYIEGYYGRLLTWADRLDIVKRVAEGGGTVYLIAPKEDPNHRQSWRQPYGKPWREQCTVLVRAARRLGVEIIPGMAPGLSFDYTSEKDYADLLKKMSVFLALGCSQIALLMDDIPDVLPKPSLGRFSSLGHAHGLLLKRLAKDLGMEGAPRHSPAGSRGRAGHGADARLWFCPTVYCDDFSRGGVGRDPYLKDLAAHAPRNITVMWTGKGIVSREVSAADISPLAELFPGGVVLWDNLYANDYCPGKIFLGPYRGRPASLRKKLAGVLLNPTGLVETDKFYLDLLAAWRRGRPSGPAWEEALARMEVPQAMRKLIGYLYLPQYALAPSLLATQARVKARGWLKPLLWNWKAPVQREWYPFLFMLDADLRLDAGGSEKPDKAWLHKRYTPIIAGLLTGLFTKRK